MITFCANVNVVNNFPIDLVCLDIERFVLELVLISM
jgi:hypothetical protein